MHKINWKMQWDDWKGSPIKETFLLLRWLRNKIIIRYQEWKHGDEVRQYTSLMQKLIGTNKAVQHNLRMSGINTRNPYNVEVSYHNKAVLIEQNKAELIYQYQAIEELTNG